MVPQKEQIKIILMHPAGTFHPGRAKWSKHPLHYCHLLVFNFYPFNSRSGLLKNNLNPKLVVK